MITAVTESISLKSVLERADMLLSAESWRLLPSSIRESEEFIEAMKEASPNQATNLYASALKGSSREIPKAELLAH